MGKSRRVQLSKHFSINAGEDAKEDVLSINVAGYGLVKLEIFLASLSITVHDDGVEPRFEFLVPHETFGSGDPTVKVRGEEVLGSTDDDDPEEQYLNKYVCVCGHRWADVWSCGCNDRCPKCNKEIEPTSSDRIRV